MAEPMQQGLPNTKQQLNVHRFCIFQRINKINCIVQYVELNICTVRGKKNVQSDMYSQGRKE